MNDIQAAGIKLLVPYLLSGKRLTADQLRVGQMVTFLLTHGILLRRTRKDYRYAGAFEALTWTAGEEMLRAALRALTGTAVR